MIRCFDMITALNLSSFYQVDSYRNIVNRRGSGSDSPEGWRAPTGHHVEKIFASEEENEGSKTMR
jgi:hypothetical protein